MMKTEKKIRHQPHQIHQGDLEMTITYRFPVALAAVLCAFSAGAAMAHGDAVGHKAQAAQKKEQQPWGIAGSSQSVSRVVEIGMSDAMRFDPAEIKVKEGETIRFVVSNKGAMMHEMVIGTKKALEEHAAMMIKFPTMEHDEAHMVHVGVGQKQELVWTFNRPGYFNFACLIPGHYQAGMVGGIKVEPRK
jgi:uncharacterized cupredoxin-like copper-binding protein